MAIKNIKPKTKKGYQIIKPNGKVLFEDVYPSKAAAAQTLMWTINGTLDKKLGSAVPIKAYNKIIPYLNCMIVNINQRQ